MDIKLTDSLLRHYLKTEATPQEIADKLSLCGPTVDRLEQVGGEWVYDIEVITNRVDSASAFGIAREANAILPQFSISSQLLNNPYETSLNDLGELPTNQPVTVDIVDSTLVPRFACIAMKNVTVKPSSNSVVKTLEMVGERGLNNVVDITNELTLKYGQPVHVFDLDRIADKTMIVRESHAGEAIETLDSKTHKLKGGDIVIEDGQGRLIDLCGIMGGELSAVTEDTKNILLFVQTYEPKRIRRTSLYTQERTLASQLFEKQPDPELVLPVLIEGVKLLQERAGAVISSALLDIYTHKRQSKKVVLNLDWLEQFAGIKIPKSQIVDILHRLGFTTQQKSEAEIVCGVPSWRLHDVSIREDVAEEITRVYGYFRLPSVLPVTEIPKIGTDDKLKRELQTRNFMARMGFTEVYNSSLISESQHNGEPAFKLQNPLSEDFVYMRTTLIPSLKQNVLNNRATVPLPQKMFELSNVYLKQENQQLAHEQAMLGIAVIGESFREFKGYIEALGTSLENVTFEQFENAWVAEVNYEQLLQKTDRIHRFQLIPQSTPVIEDLTFTIPEKTPVGPIIGVIKLIDTLVAEVELKTIYKQNYTFTISYRVADRTLTSEEVAPIRKAIVKQLESQEIKLVGEV